MANERARAELSDGKKPVRLWDFGSYPLGAREGFSWYWVEIVTCIDEFAYMVRQFLAPGFGLMFYSGRQAVRAAYTLQSLAELLCNFATIRCDHLRTRAEPRTPRKRWKLQNPVLSPFVRWPFLAIRRLLASLYSLVEDLVYT